MPSTPFTRFIRKAPALPCGSLFRSRCQQGHAIKHLTAASTRWAPSRVGSLPGGSAEPPARPARRDSSCASPAPAPCGDSTSHPLPLPLRTPPNRFAIGLRISRFYTSYLSATVPPIVQRGRGQQGIPAALSSRCPAANPNIVLLLLKGISKSLSSIRCHRADATRVEAGISFSPFPEELRCAPRALRDTACPGSPAGGSAEGRRREAGRGLSEGRRNNFRSLHSLFLSGNTSC